MKSPAATPPATGETDPARRDLSTAWLYRVLRGCFRPTPRGRAYADFSSPKATRHDRPSRPSVATPRGRTRPPRPAGSSEPLGPAARSSFLKPIAPAGPAQATVPPVIALLALVTATWVFLAPSIARAAGSEPPVGYTQTAVNYVSALAPDRSRRFLDAPSPVFSAETLETGTASTGQFEFWDGARLVMAPESSLVLSLFVDPPDRNDPRRVMLSLGLGVFRAVTEAVAAPKNLELDLDTPLGIIGIRGTDVIVRLTATDLSFSVLSGGPVTFFDRERGQALVVPTGLTLTRLRDRPPRLAPTPVELADRLARTAPIDLAAAKACRTAIARTARIDPAALVDPAAMKNAYLSGLTGDPDSPRNLDAKAMDARAKATFSKAAGTRSDKDKAGQKDDGRDRDGPGGRGGGAGGGGGRGR